MNVLLTIAGPFSSTYGGGQTYVRRLAAALTEQPEVSLHIAAALPKSAATEPGVHSLSAEHAEDDLRQLLRNLRPDIVHAHGIKAATARACRAEGIPCIVTAHHGGIICPTGALLNEENRICRAQVSHRNCLNCVLSSIKGGRWVGKLCRHIPPKLYRMLGFVAEKLPFIPFITPIVHAAQQIYRKRREWLSISQCSSRIIAPSVAMADTLRRHGLPQHRVKLLPHGAPSQKNGSYPPGADKCLRFYCVGRICREKGIHVLLAAFASLASSTAELHIFGGAATRQEQRYQAELLRQYIHHPRLYWHGQQPEDKLDSLTRNCHILVHPAICLEVFGLDMAEALSAGKWVLATRCGGAEMQVKPGLNGWLVEPNSVTELATAMQRILDSPPLTGPSCHFSSTFPQHAEQLCELYHHIIQDEKKKSAH